MFSITYDNYKVLQLVHIENVCATTAFSAFLTLAFDLLQCNLFFFSNCNYPNSAGIFFGLSPTDLNVAPDGSGGQIHSPVINSIFLSTKDCNPFFLRRCICGMTNDSANSIPHLKELMFAGCFLLFRATTALEFTLIVSSK